MGKPRRPRGPRSTWEPKIVVTEAARDGEPDATAPATTEPCAGASMADDPPGEGQAADAPAAEATPTVGPLPGPDGSRAAAPTAVAEPASVEAGSAAAARVSTTVDVAAATPAPLLPAVIPDAVTPEAPLAPVRRRSPLRLIFAPERLDLADIGTTIAGYVRGEGEAVFAHMRALGGVRSPADLIRLQVGEAQRAADASLTCWSTVARKAGRVFALR